MLHNILTYQNRLLIVSLVLFLASFAVIRWEQKPIKLETIATKAAQDLKKLEQDFYETADDAVLVKRLATEQYSFRDLEAFFEKTYTFLVYNNKKLVFWNNNEVVPLYKDISFYEEGADFFSLPNSSYQIVKKQWDSTYIDMSKITVVGLQLIRYSHEAENKYLKNKINPSLDIAKEVKISTQNGSQSVALSSKKLKQPLYISHDNVALSKKVSYWAILLQTISIFLLLLVLNHIALNIAKERSPLNGFLFLTATFVLIKVVMNYAKLPIGIYHLKLFEPTDISTSIGLLSSTGDLFFAAIIFLWLIAFFHIKVHFNLKNSGNLKIRLRYYVTLMSIVSLAAFLIYYMIRSQIMQFNNSLDISNIFVSFDTVTFIAMLTLAFVLIGFFFICQKIAVLIEQLQLSLKNRVLGLGVILLLYLLSLFFISFQKEHLYVLAWVLVFAARINIFSSASYKQISPSRLAFWVFFFSSFAALLIYSFTIEKENENREKYADKIAIQEDTVTEFWFEEAAKKIMINDDIVIKYFSNNPLLPEKELVKRIKKLYLNTHFDKYGITILPFNKEGGLIKHEDKTVILKDFEERIRYKGIHTNNNYLYLMANNEGGYNYLAKLPIFNPKAEIPSPIGFMVIELNPKSNEQANVYPELIIEDKFREPEEFLDYSYAVYNNNLLESSKGSYAYNSQQDSSIAKNAKPYKYIRKNDFSHLIYVPESDMERNTKIIMVSYNSNNVMKLLSLISYLFVFAFGFLFIIIGINSIFKSSDDKLDIRDLIYSSLRKRINFAMLVTIFISFLVIGAVTVNYFYNRAADYHRKRLDEKQKEILASINDMRSRKRAENEEKVINKKLVEGDEIDEIVKTLSKIHSIDINLFNPNGDLLTCSQPLIFENHLVSKQMHPAAYFELSKLHRSQYVQYEKIGDLTYLAAYMPIHNELKTKVLGYLNLPYFEQEKEVRSEISTFLVALINLYMLLWLGAGLIAVFVSNSITNPLRMISNRLKEVELGGQNELLEWPDKDEIGELVEQYNKTIIALDESAKLLAESERKSAWQQMARQVAHEIKNPLTPMKLSVQYLQRAINNNHPNVQALTERVARTLIEQIDTLSRIASEFSNFAQMPKPVNDVHDFKAIIDNAVNLYKDTDDDEVSIYALLPKEECFVFADKDQLLRVFNNLIKNAIQAIPDDRDGVIMVKMTQENNLVKVEVNDNGSGIDEEKREKVFVPNFTTKNSGMGLGLAMSRQIVGAAKGKIWFETVVDEGTSFFVELPTIEPEASDDLYVASSSSSSIF
ncbi:MAG: ATP-binding protein [Chitinophagales bacterium]